MLDGEAKLIQDAVRGESSAFGSLYDYYHPKIYRFVLVRTGQREEAEDLTHQVFMNAWTSISRYEEQGFPFSSWLYRIARNQIVDHYRRRKEAVSLDSMEPEYAAGLATTESTGPATLEFERVLKGVRTLKPEYQEVIMMRFVEEMPLKEVALALEKSEGAVKLMQHRALKQLKTILLN